jgi:hypothetical protein
LDEPAVQPRVGLTFVEHTYVEQFLWTANLRCVAAVLLQ